MDIGAWNPFQLLDPPIRALVHEYEEAGDWEGALEELRQAAFALKVLGYSHGEDVRGELRREASRLQNAASNAERNYAKEIGSELRKLGIKLTWREIRDKGWRQAYAENRKDQGGHGGGENAVDLDAPACEGDGPGPGGTPGGGPVQGGEEDTDHGAEALW